MLDLTKLNPPQREAVETTEGPLLVFAGAGSGKTRVLTYRMAHMIERGVRPWNILAITFTNKAAREMRERVDLLSPGATEDAWVMTFHAACARILRRDIEKIGYKREFTIFDEDDKMTVIKHILKDLNINDKNYPPRSVKAVISDAKNRMLSPDEWLKENPDARSRPYYKIYVEYENRLKANNALDFDDLLVKTLELLVENPPVLESYQNKFRYIMVDEYQDTNVAQYQLIRLLAGESKNVCVVGDDDQSIYGWRGADIRNILNFEKDFGSTKVIKLEENYRSTSTILEAANKVIRHNTARKDKTLWTEAGDGEKIKLCHAADERDEAAWVCDNIKQLEKQGCELGDMAVLYRTNAQSRVLEEALVRRGVKYGVYGGLKFYDRKEIKDVVAYLRLLVNPEDDVAFRRVINEPRRGIGDASVEALSTYAANNNMSLLSAAFDAGSAGLGSRAVSAITGFADLMADLTGKLIDMPMTEFIVELMSKTGLRKQYENSKDPEDESKAENLDEFVAAVTEYERVNPEEGILGFLENVALVTDTDRLDERTKIVTLMTIHSAKGLEFENVFITGLEETVFPLMRAMEEDNQLEEERRLMYVGITRAKKRLFLSHARTRTLYNSRQANQMSRFVSEIPRALIEDGRKAAPSVRLTMPSRPMPQYAEPHMPKKTTLGNIPGVTRGFGTAAPAAPRAVSTTFKPGDRVHHRSFGDGIVTGINEKATGYYISVDFGKFIGVKIMDANTAPITLIEE